MSRATWGSRLGFIFAVAGSAVGLANIWRFPYMVGQNGGGAFILVYLLCLALIGFPVFLSEILIGRQTGLSPGLGFSAIGKSKNWGYAGRMTILTGFIVSAFYSAVAGWMLGYLFEALKGQLHLFESADAVIVHHESLMQSPLWSASFHAFFLIASVAVLYGGVRGGIEKWNKLFMPLLLIILAGLAVYGLLTKGGADALYFMLYPDFSALTPIGVLAALGHSFFTLSLGQGTMVTYGSYLDKKSDVLKGTLPVVAVDTLVSLLATLSIMAIVFSAGMEPSSGPGLVFHTLPWVFSQLPGGFWLAILFFLLVTSAALTSEVSALEPSIAYFVDEKGWSRKKAVLIVAIGAFFVGLPSALSFNLLKDYTFSGLNCLEWFDYLTTHLLIPLGGLAAVVLIGWRYGAKKAIDALSTSDERQRFFSRPVRFYFWFCFKYGAPILMAIVFLHSMGVF